MEYKKLSMKLYRNCYLKFKSGLFFNDLKLKSGLTLNAHLKFKSGLNIEIKDRVIIVDFYVEY
jgi:hypothetical protein